MANKITEEFNTQVALIRGSGGVFDVAVNGNVVFSKHAVGDFPNEEAFLQEMRTLLK